MQAATVTAKRMQTLVVVSATRPNQKRGPRKGASFFFSKKFLESNGQTVCLHAVR